MTPKTNEHVLERVRNYYDRSTTLYLRYFGATMQAGLLATNVTSYGSADFLANNLFFAARAGLGSGMRVLDAGCGVGGPSIDMALNIDGLVIDGITISPVQAEFARRRVAAANLVSRLRIHVGDYHDMPFDEGTFDAAMFLESAGHSHAPVSLFREARRVLVEGGTLYIKDLFVRSGPLSLEQSAELDLLNSVFAYRTSTLAATCRAVQGAGFRAVTAVDLDSHVSIVPIVRAMADWSAPKPKLNEFGKMHYKPFRCVPIHFGEVKATR